MKEKEIINTLLLKEVEIVGKMNNAVTEIIRLGIESERGKNIIKNTIDSVRYSLDDLEMILNRK